MPAQYGPQQMVWRRLRLLRRARKCRDVSHAWREFGVSRKAYCEWRKRLGEAGGDPQALRDRSRHPRSHPCQATAARQRLICRCYRRLHNWNHRYNTNRPRGALGWKTPAQGLTQYSQSLSDGVAYV